MNYLKMGAVPTFFGDTFYPVMVYFGIIMTLINLNLKKIAILAFLFALPSSFFNDISEIDR